MHMTSKIILVSLLWYINEDYQNLLPVDVLEPEVLLILDIFWLESEEVAERGKL